MNINKKNYSIILLLIIAVILISCSKEDSYETVSNKLSTKEDGLYNLYFFYGNDEYSKNEYNKFKSDWKASKHMNVYNTRSYNISDGYGDLNELYFDTLNIDKENVPIFILFDNNGIVLRTKEINMVLLYLKNIDEE